MGIKLYSWKNIPITRCILEREILLGYNYGHMFQIFWDRLNFRHSVLLIDHVIPLFGFGNIIIVHVFSQVVSSFFHIEHNSFYPRPGSETDMDITCVFSYCVFFSQFHLPLKMKIWCLLSLQEDWQIVPFIYCCCGVMRYALYSWRLSKKLFTSQYIQNRSHLGLMKICQAIFVFIDIDIYPTVQCYKSS